MRYVTYNEEGSLTGCYLQDVLPEHELCYKEVPESFVNNWANYKLVNGQLTLIPAQSPPPIVPLNVLPRQIRQAMSRVPFGETTLRQVVEGAISQGEQDIKDWYEFATEFYRHHESVILLASLLGVSEEDLDALWTLAASL